VDGRADIETDRQTDTGRYIDRYKDIPINNIGRQTERYTDRQIGYTDRYIDFLFSCNNFISP
jgi:hypothetical protein